MHGSLGQLSASWNLPSAVCSNTEELQDSYKALVEELRCKAKKKPAIAKKLSSRLLVAQEPLFRISRFESWDSSLEILAVKVSALDIDNSCRRPRAVTVWPGRLQTNIRNDMWLKSNGQKWTAITTVGAIFNLREWMPFPVRVTPQVAAEPPKKIGLQQSASARHAQRLILPSRGEQSSRGHAFVLCA